MNDDLCSVFRHMLNVEFLLLYTFSHWFLFPKFFSSNLEICNENDTQPEYIE